MRKTSQDGGDSTSITSGVENEIKRSAMKSKKSSLKRKTPNFSNDSDDTVIEPLLQKDKEKPEANQSAKFFNKGKTDSISDKGNDKAKLITDNKTKTPGVGFCGTTESLLSMKEYETPKTTMNVTAPLHNYMNTNVFNSHENSIANVTTKSQILVEIDGTKQSGYTPSPLIFTTAKIHTDGKSKHMEPVQVTPVPILSTIEVSVSKGGSITTNEKKISNGSSVHNPAFTQSISKEPKTVNNINTISSTISNKEPSVKPHTTASTSKFANNTFVQTTTVNNLPSTTPISLSIISNNKEKQVAKDVQKDQSPLQTTQPLLKSHNSFKNNVTVKITHPSSANFVDNSIKSNKSGQEIHTDPCNLNKLPDKSTKKEDESKINNNNNQQQLPSNVKLPSSSKISMGVSNPTSSFGSIAGNKQLQRQKTTTDDTNISDQKIKENIGRIEDSSTKVPVSSKLEITSKKIDNFSKDSDKSPKPSANHPQNTIKSSLNTTANLNSKMSSSTATTTSQGTLPMTSPTNTSSNKSIVSSSVSLDKATPVAVSSLNPKLNINKTCSPTVPVTDSITNSKPVSSNTSTIKTSSIPKSTAKEKSFEISSMQPKSSVEKSPSNTISAKTTTANTTITKSVPLSKPPTTDITAFTATTAKIPAASVSKTAIIKAPPITTSVKTTTANSMVNSEKNVNSTKPFIEAVTTKAGTNSKYSSTVVGATIKTPVATASTKTTLPSTIGTVSSKISTKPITNVTTASEKPTTVSMLSKNQSVKTTEANSNVSSNKKIPTTSASKTPTDTMSIKTPSMSSSTMSTAKVQTSTVAGKDAVEKVNNSKIPSKVTSSTINDSIAKTLPSTVSSSTVTTTALPGSTSNSSASKPSISITLGLTTSVTTKPTTVTTHMSTNKSSTGDPASSSTSKTSDTTKKGGTKSSECNKDGKVSKA